MFFSWHKAYWYHVMEIEARKHNAKNRTEYLNYFFIAAHFGFGGVIGIKFETGARILNYESLNSTSAARTCYICLKKL